jgi:hypothetical protein
VTGAGLLDYNRRRTARRAERVVGRRRVRVWLLEPSRWARRRWSGPWRPPVARPLRVRSSARAELVVFVFEGETQHRRVLLRVFLRDYRRVT